MRLLKGIGLGLGAPQKAEPTKGGTYKRRNLQKTNEVIERNRVRARGTTKGGTYKRRNLQKAEPTKNK